MREELIFLKIILADWERIKYIFENCVTKTDIIQIEIESD